MMIIFGSMIDDLSDRDSVGDRMTEFAYMYIGASACEFIIVQYSIYRNNIIIVIQAYIPKRRAFSEHHLVSVNIIAGYFAHAFMLLAAESQCNRIRIEYFRAIMRQEIGWFDEKSSGELTTRLSRYV